MFLRHLVQRPRRERQSTEHCHSRIAPLSLADHGDEALEIDGEHIRPCRRRGAQTIVERPKCRRLTIGPHGVDDAERTRRRHGKQMEQHFGRRPRSQSVDRVLDRRRGAGHEFCRSRSAQSQKPGDERGRERLECQGEHDHIRRVPVQRTRVVEDF